MNRNGFILNLSTAATAQLIVNGACKPKMNFKSVMLRKVKKPIRVTCRAAAA